jgi:hypothetical protein
MIGLSKENGPGTMALKTPEVVNNNIVLDETSTLFSHGCYLFSLTRRVVLESR